MERSRLLYWSREKITDDDGIAQDACRTRKIQAGESKGIGDEEKFIQLFGMNVAPIEKNIDDRLLTR